jgi:hypothetical protein
MTLNSIIKSLAPASLLKQQHNRRGRSAVEKAPNCTSPPTANTSTANETAHLWGWNSQHDESCTFKDSNGDVIWYLLTALMYCRMPF